MTATATATANVRIAAHHPPAGLLARRVLAPRRMDEGPAPGVRRTFIRGEELFAEGEAADSFYKVVSGTVRVCKLLSDGRRQIEAFQLPGDIFGLESGTEHHFTAEAVEDTVVIAFRRGRFASLLHDNPSFGDQLMSAVIVSLERAQEHMVLLGRKTAEEKIATFLLDMSRRLANGDRVDLPMQRTDIADHLGLTIETVSRTLSQMVRDGLIKLAATGRTIVISNMSGLQALNG
jgi:CRP/FNR family nitrogen fixation transcriptional regulator